LGIERAVVRTTRCLYFVTRPASVASEECGASPRRSCRYRSIRSEGTGLAVAHRSKARVIAREYDEPNLQRSDIMSTQATVTVNAAKKAVYDKFESQIHTFEAQLSTLKAKAESAKADAELKAIANLVTAKRALDQKLAELKKTGEAAFQQAKAEVEVRIAEFDRSVKEIQSKITAGRG
jgi:hypothetical protein